MGDMFRQKARRLPARLVALLRPVGAFLRSVRFRLALWFVLILGVVVIAFSVFIYYRQLYDLRGAAVDRLEYRTQKLRSFFKYTDQKTFAGVPFHLPEDQAPGNLLPGDPEGEDPGDQEGDILALIDLDGRVVQNWGPLEADGAAQIAGRAMRKSGEEQVDSPALYSAVVSGKRPKAEYILLFTPVASEGERLGYLLLGSPVDPGGSLPRLLASLALGVIATLGFALAGGVWLADRAIRPVKTITQAARRIGETDLSLRLHLNRKDELGELASTFDEMLARLEAAFDRQRQFTADASHELRTPLTIVNLETDHALARRRTPEEYERALWVIKSENDYMTHLVGDLLTLARMDAGQVALHKQELDLSDLALEVVERLAPLAKKNGVRLTAGDLPELPILGDRQYLIQLLTNLVENAIKYTTGQEKQVEVQSGRIQENHRLLAWARVTDNGPGIPPEHLPRLFDRFYQVDRARTQTIPPEPPGEEEAAGRATPSGTGLGLSIVDWIARAHEGEIRVQSVYGKGSSFEVRLPLVEKKGNLHRLRLTR